MENQRDINWNIVIFSLLFVLLTGPLETRALTLPSPVRADTAYCKLYDEHGTRYENPENIKPFYNQVGDITRWTSWHTFRENGGHIKYISPTVIPPASLTIDIREIEVKADSTEDTNKPHGYLYDFTAMTNVFGRTPPTIEKTPLDGENGWKLKIGKYNYLLFCFLFIDGKEYPNDPMAEKFGMAY